MKQQLSNRIKMLRAERGLSQAELAEALGAHWITISKLERGKLRLTQTWMVRIAEALSVSPAELLELKPDIRSIYIEGDLLNDARSVNLQMRDETWFKPMAVYVDLGTPNDHQDLWVNVITDVFWPIIHPGDYIKFVYLKDWNDIETLIGRLCIVHSENRKTTKCGILRWIGKDRIFDLDLPGSFPVRNFHVDEVAGASIIIGHPQMTGSATKPAD